MKKNRFSTIFLSVTGALLLTGCAHEQETITHPNTILWPSCSFEEACDTLEYFQHGGVSKRYIIQYEGLPGLPVGERALLFLNEGGVMISPAFRFVIDENGDIQTHLLPEGYSGDSVTLSADEYAALIEAYLEK